MRLAGDRQVGRQNTISVPAARAASAFAVIL